MKILVSNYATNESTEAIYLNTAFNAAGCESTLWPNNISTYDIFDIVNPDIHITHHSKLSQDLALYLQQAPNIDIIINVTGMNQNLLRGLEEKLHEFNIKPRLFIVNYHNHNLKSKTNIITLLHGADIFFGRGIKQYNIEYGIFVNDKKQINPIGQTYHYLSTKENLQNDADICLPEYKMAPLLINYDSIVFKYFDKTMPQIFYDAAYYGNKVFFDVENRNTLDDIFIKLFGENNYCNIKDTNSGHVGDKIKEKHTCLHRAKSLLSQFAPKEYTDNIQNIIEGTLK